MISKITKRIFLVMACCATYNAQGALTPSSQESGREFLATGGGLLLATCIGMYNQQNIRSTFGHLLSPAPVPEGTEARNIVSVGRMVAANETIYRGLRRNPLHVDVANDVWNGAQAFTGVIALKVALNGIQGKSWHDGVKPFFYSAASAGFGYSWLKYLPRFFTNYVTNAETYAFGGLSIFTLAYLGAKIAFKKRGCIPLDL
jgi:hypothetical protein